MVILINAVMVTDGNTILNGNMRVVLSASNNLYAVLLKVNFVLLLLIVWKISV